MEEKLQVFMSEQINELAAALSAFQSSVTHPKLNKEVSVKTKTGGAYKFKYADLAECVKASAPALKENGLAVSQIIVNGYLFTLLLHTSGQWLRSTIALGYEKLDGFQALGSAITYLKRYSYCAILGIVADADDDANFADGNFADIKDRKKSASSVAFTGEQLKQALAELAEAKTNEDYNQCWAKWSTTVPALCVKGTEFYNACAKKAQELK